MCCITDIVRLLLMSDKKTCRQRHLRLEGEGGGGVFIINGKASDDLINGRFHYFNKRYKGQQI